MNARALLAAAALAAAAVAAAPSPRVAAQDTVAAVEPTLASGKWEDRRDGARRLAALGKSAQAERLLLPLLKDPDWGVRVEGALALGKCGSETARPALVRMAVEGEIQVLRDAAVSALAALGAEAAAGDLLAASRADKEPEAKVRALRAYGSLAGPAAVPLLKPYHGHRDGEVFAEAVRAAGRIGLRHPEAAAHAADFAAGVLKERGDRKFFLAYAAAVEALAHLPTEKARDLVVEEVFRLADEDGYLPERIARGLLSQGTDTAAAAVKRILEGAARLDPATARRSLRLAGRVGAAATRVEVQGFLAHKDDRVRSEAARCLGLLGDPAAAIAVEPLLKDKSPFVRREALSAVARVHSWQRLKPLAIACLEDPEEEIRVQAVVELHDLGNPAAVPVLELAFPDKSWRVAAAALAAAGALGIGEDLPRFEPYLAHKAWQVRGAAYEALGRLRAAAAIPKLTEGLGDPDPVVRGVCLANLQILTREKTGPDLKAWRAWWKANGEALNLVKRSRRPEAERKKDEEETRYAHEVRKYGVEVLQKARILVVTGAWDKGEKVLEHLKIPHTVLRAQQLKEAGLNPNQIVLVNCEGNVDKDSAERLRWFATTGGYLMSTDWALTKAVQTCFPGYARQYAGSNTGNDVVVVEDAAPGHPYTRDVFDGVPAMMWWLEIQAFPIAVEYPERCEVLVDSVAMKQRYGSSPMAVAFRWGLGRIQHSVSHFYLQEEGMSKATTPLARKIFAADNMGLGLDQIRALDAKKAFDGQITEATMKEIAPDYSMFRLIVNFTAEKSRWVENL